MSKNTSDHERKYTSFELEVLAVVEALKKFRIYVLGTSFKIITDCDALVKTLSKKELNPRIARWALYLQEYNYTIEHRTGSKMAHVDALSRPPHYHLGPLATTSKKYKHVFAVIDAFSKFTWLYPTRSTDAAEVINRLENQRHVFGNPARIITDKGSAFTSSAFEDYCKKQNILHISITTGLPRSNGQIEKQNSTIISVLSKLSVDDPEKWYSHVPHLQEILNSTFQRSIKMTPFVSSFSAPR
ncbi:hypothetical protein TNCV_4401021 [Trichonephila clavipes]|nr:hypothetical protein TNCV_4401021 [Trichonephila clavipes]